jgi:hypothetical protein
MDPSDGRKIPVELFATRDGQILVTTVFADDGLFRPSASLRRNTPIPRLDQDVIGGACDSKVMSRGVSSQSARRFFRARRMYTRLQGARFS